MILILGSAAESVVVDDHVAHGNALVLELTNDLNDTIIGIHIGVFQVGHLTVLHQTGTVSNAQLLQALDLGGHVLAVNVLLVEAVAGNHGHDQSGQNDQDDQGERNDSHRALAQTDHSVLEEADGLSLELFVHDLLAFLHHGKVGSREIFQLLGELILQINNHLLPPPTRMRGSMIP